MKTSSLRVLLPAAALCASLSMACTGKTLDVGSADSEKQAGSGTPNTIRPVVLDDACDAPHGTPVAMTKLGDIKAHMAGKWYRCDTTQGTPWTKTGQGIEFVPKDNGGGTYYALDFDANGQPTRESGLDGSGNYLVSIATDTSEPFPYTDATPFGQMFVSSQGEINAGPPAGSVDDASDYFEFETNPRRMRMDGKIWFILAPEIINVVSSGQ